MSTPPETATRPFTSADQLYATPNPLAPHYSRFDVANRLLLTGHSHQAWPDVGYHAQLRAWNDAAEYVDDKWELAFAQADRVRAGYARLIGCDASEIALGANTHELVVRLLSALPLRDKPRLVTTDGEFHAIRRQLDRLAEEGIEIVKVDREPVDSVAERLAHAVDARAAACLISSVFYLDARIVPNLPALAAACRQHGLPLLVDAYHHLNVVPFALDGIEDAFVTGGGYKYCQLGEGNGFLRIPPGQAELRPLITGWFAEFGELTAGEREQRVPYASGPTRFAGGTYDPTSNYRAAAVFDFSAQQGLTAPLLREVSQHQIRLLADAFDALDLDPAVVDRDRSIPRSAVGGFLALRSRHAAELRQRLDERRVYVDHRGDVLRLGPAPYLTEPQLQDAIAALGDAAAAL